MKKFIRRYPLGNGESEFCGYLVIEDTPEERRKYIEAYLTKDITGEKYQKFINGETNTLVCDIYGEWKANRTGVLAVETKEEILSRVEADYKNFISEIEKIYREGQEKNK